MDPDDLQKQIDNVYSNLLTLIKLQDQAKREQKQNTLLQQSKSQLDSQKRNSNEKITTTTAATSGSKTKVSTKRLDDIFEYDDFDYRYEGVSNGRLAKGSFLDTHMPKSNSRLRQSKLSTSGQSSVRFTMPSATGSKYETLNRVKTKYQQPSVTVQQFPSTTGTSGRNNTKSSFHKCRAKTKKGQRTGVGNSSNENLSAELQSESEAFMDVDNSSSSMPSLSPNHNSNNVGFESSQIKQGNKQGKIKSSTWVSTNNRKAGSSSMAVVSYSHPPTLFDAASNRVGSTISTSTSVTTSSTTTNRKQPLTTTSLFQGPPRDDGSSSPVSGGSSTTSLSVSQPDRANALMMPQATTGGGNSYYCNLLTNEFREKNQLVVATIQKQGSLTKKAIEERNKVLLKMSDIRKQMVNIIKDVPRILATTTK